MKKYSFWDKVKYIFDNTMSRGAIALILWLTVFTSILIVVISAITFLGNMAPGSPKFPELLWIVLMRALDPGNVSGDEGILYRPLMFLLTLMGIFIFSTLIGIITTGIETKIEELREGKSRVIETNHTIIFGWSEQVFTIIQELIIANDNQKKSCIVILGEQSKVEMEEEIKKKVGKTGKTRIVCRQGSPIDINDIEIANIDSSKSIIILSPETEDPDSSVIKTMLAIINNPNRNPETYNIVAEIRDPKNTDVAQLVGKDEAEIVLIGDLISKVIAQTCRQSGLSQVYGELMSFEGNEIYFAKESGLTGKIFGDAIFRYEDSVLIGIKQKGKPPKLNPAKDIMINAEDELLFIAEDDDTMVLSDITEYNINETIINHQRHEEAKQERTLILGWNWRITGIINELDNYVTAGSELIVVAEKKYGERIIQESCTGIKNQRIKFIREDTTDRRTLDRLKINEFNHIIILCYSDDLEPQKSDAKTLITLLHLRDIAEKLEKSGSIVSEMIDIRNRNLAEITQADDFIVSDRLTSKIISQISEDKLLHAVFQDLFSPEGSEIYLKSITDYISTDKEVNFYTLTESAKLKDEVAIGYRLMKYANDSTEAYGIKINPPKSQLIKVVDDDYLIVLAED
ncbi:potassium transporter TrkA [Candidatus Dependentiae bacterium]|nr:potassium transporter TrkA [Candidatus Dependentiae bacterium]